MIKEKEKLFMELKNILARQPGPEIQHQLIAYKDSLKEKSAQMKKMLAELKNAREQVRGGTIHVHLFTRLRPPHAG